MKSITQQYREFMVIQQQKASLDGRPPLDLTLEEFAGLQMQKSMSEFENYKKGVFKDLQVTNPEMANTLINFHNAFGKPRAIRLEVANEQGEMELMLDTFFLLPPSQQITGRHYIEAKPF